MDERPGCLEAERPAAEKRAGLDDGLALSLSAAMGSVAGLLGWVVSTRLLTPSDIGKAAEVVAAILMIGGIAQLNLSVGMLRWIPGAGRFTARLASVRGDAHRTNRRKCSCPGSSPASPRSPHPWATAV